jgi:TatD DNase family protein
MLADSHLHLDRYTDEEASAMLQRARQAGVTGFLTIGVDLASSERAIALAQQHAGLFAAVGWHPAFLRPGFGPREQEQLRALAWYSSKVVAIGEAGIDLLDAQTPLELQQQAFSLHLQLVQELNLPLILHQQAAEHACQELLQQAYPARGVVVHYFVGDLASARRWLDLGCMLSVGKPVTRPEHAALREAVAAVPLERLLLETDTYPLPGRTTEPAHLRQIAEAVAALKNLPLETVAEQTTANFCRLLRLDDG